MKRFQEITESGLVLENGKPLFETIKGKWNEEFFRNPNPITVELGCGKGEYSVGLAEINQTRNYIGVDIKGERIWVGQNLVKKKDLKNVGFLRTQIHLLEKFFGLNEVDEFWLTFPDPRPKDKDEKRRLCSPAFLAIYKRLLKPGGWFRFKTDNTGLFDYVMDLINSGSVEVDNLEYTRDLYESNLNVEHFGIRTKYEKIWADKGEKIKYMKFQFVNHTE